nr:hypothetical protein [Pedobacter sp. ASV2]
MPTVEQLRTFLFSNCFSSNTKNRTIDTRENLSLEHQTEDKSNIPAGNYHQRQADGADQIILTDPAITAETDELDPSF